MCHPLLSVLFRVELNKTDESKFRNDLVHFLPCHWSVEELRPSLYVALQSNLIQTNLIPIKFVVPST